ncbi:MAG TPA: DNA internalization-related competence protein ComEC/Rec2 [Candidatus Binataceae bacterium]|nr:DNA internalization-related competence protein ComEC/Rec2 [Candidatus Binataceae bacterium]
MGRAPVRARTTPGKIRIAPIYAVAIAIVAGDAAGNFHLYAPLWTSVALAFAMLVAMLARRPRLGLAAACLAIACAASVAVEGVLAPGVVPGAIRDFPDHAEVTIEGRVVREPEDMPGRERLYVEVERAGLARQDLEPSSGTVRIAEFDPAAFEIGDEIRLTARLRFPRNFGDPGEFDYEGFMARSGVDATMTAARTALGTPAFEILSHHRSFPGSRIESIRRQIGVFIDRNLEQPEAAEMRALVIGDRGGITEGLRQKFAHTGMAHLLVISGLHLSMVAAVAFAIGRLGLMMVAPGLASRGYANKAAAIGAALAVTAYATIAGHHVSTTRALVMVLAYMLAIVIDRAREAIASLALAAIVICFAIPGSSADIGFQLSFASVIAILLGMQRFVAWTETRKRLGRLPGEKPARGWWWIEIIGGYLAVSFWAMLATAPLTAYSFNQVSFIGIAANAIVVPIMGFFATIAGLFAAALSFICEPAAQIILHLGGYALAISNALAQWFANLPGAWMPIFTPTILEVALAYSVLLAWLLAPRAAQPARNLRSRKMAIAHIGIAIVLAIAVIADAAWWINDRYFSRDLRVTFLAVGEGDSAVVRFPGSRVMLIDAGGAYPGFDAGERLIARYLWSLKIMTVDYMALSHPDQDHFGGFGYVAANFHPGEFWTSASGSDDRSYAQLLDELHALHVPTKVIKADTPNEPIGGVWIESLGRTADSDDPSHNNASMVLRLSLGDNSFLFTGDIEAPAERAIMQEHSDLRATVLKVPHHGSSTSSSQAFIEAVAPQFAVISTGYMNRFHFPAPAVIDRYEMFGSTVMRTDLDGAVMADASANRLAISTSWGEPMVTPHTDILRPAHRAPGSMEEFILTSFGGSY